MVSDEEKEEEERRRKGREEWWKKRKERRCEQGGVVEGKWRRGRRYNVYITMLRTKTKCNRYINFT